MPKETIDLKATKWEISQKLKTALQDRRDYFKNYESKFKRVSLRFTPKEFKELQEESKKYSLTPTGYLKKLYLAKRDKKELMSQELESSFKEFVFLLRNIANNINQVAKQSNTFKKLLNPTKLKSNLKELESLIKEFIQNPKSKKLLVKTNKLLSSDNQIFKQKKGEFWEST